MEPVRSSPPRVPDAAAPPKKSKKPHQFAKRIPLAPAEVSQMKKKYRGTKSTDSLSARRVGDYVIQSRFDGNIERGTLKHEGEDRIYYGPFKNDLPDGAGMLENPKIGIFEGVWENGKLKGPLTVYSKWGNIYKGFWEDNRWVDNKAEIFFTNGDHFVGTFHNDPNKQFEREGKGIYTTKAKIYEGNWSGDKFTGGKISFLDDPELLEYQGEVRSENFNGKGALLYKDGRKVEGNFVDGKCPEGKFSIIQNGSVIYDYEGKLKNNLPDKPRIPVPSAKRHSEFESEAAPEPKLERRQKAPRHQGPANEQQPVRAPILLSFSEFVAMNVPPHQGVIDNALIHYEGDILNGKCHGNGILAYKGVNLLKEFFVEDPPRFHGTFKDDAPQNGKGLMKFSILGNSYYSYGSFKNGNIYTGVGFYPAPQGVFCGVFWEGNLLLGEVRPYDQIPTSYEVFRAHMAKLHETWHMLYS